MTPADRFTPVPEQRAGAGRSVAAADAGRSPQPPAPVDRRRRRAPSGAGRRPDLGGWAGRVGQGGAAVGEHDAVPGSSSGSGRPAPVRWSRFWVDCDLIHLFIGGTRIKTVRSHLSVTDLARLVAAGRGQRRPVTAAARSQDGDAVEVERVVSRAGTVALAAQVMLAAEILGGRRVGIRIEADHADVLRPRHPRAAADPAQPAHRPTRSPALRGIRPAGPPPRPSTEPIRVQRRASNTGVIMVCGQKVALGRIHQHQTLTIARLRDHPGDRARRRRNPRRAPHHHPAGP